MVLFIACDSSAIDMRGQLVPGDEASPSRLPGRCRLGLIVIQTEDDGGSPPVAVTWWLSADAEGNIPLTPAVTEPWRGGVARRLDIDWCRVEGQGGIYVHVEDAGDIAIRARIFWRVERLTDLPSDRPCEPVPFLHHSVSRKVGSGPPL